MKKIVFTGGGTGGHIMPNLSIIEEIKDKYEIYYLGTDGMEREIISKYPYIKFIEIPSVKLVRSLTPKNLLIPFKLVKSIKVCKDILSKLSPNLIFSKGGYVSIPVALAGHRLNIPILTHESDLTIGIANKIIAKKSKHICCTFEETANNYGKNAIHTGSPVRKQIFRGDKNKVLTKYKIDTSKPVITITGGSLGAQRINEVIWSNIDKLTKHYTLIHLVGKNKLNKSLENTKDYIQLEFTNNIEDYFNLSNLVICRAGSNTIFELLAIKKPMILLPLSKKSSRGDQILNAKNFYKKGYAEYILDESLNIETLIKNINTVLNNKDKYISAMSKSNKTNGTNDIIELIDKYIKWYYADNVKPSKYSKK